MTHVARQHEKQMRSQDLAAIRSCDDQCVSNPDVSIGLYKPVELIKSE